MEAKHTPGPWKACRAHEDYDGPYFDIAPEDQAEYDARPFTSIKAPTGTIFTAHDLFEFRGDEGNANAALIADAPAMLAALRDLYTHCSMIHKHWGDGCNREQADRAIQAGRAILERAGVQP